MKKKLFSVPPDFLIPLIALPGVVFLNLYALKTDNWDFGNGGNIRGWSYILLCAVFLSLFGYTFYETHIVIRFSGIPIWKIYWADCKHVKYKPSKRSNHHSYVLITTNRILFHWIPIGLYSPQLRPCINILTQYVGPVENWNYEAGFLDNTST